MKAMILAAGLGNRLRPLTCFKAKPALVLVDKPVIASAIELLRGAGVREAVINTHYMPASVREAVKACGSGLSLSFSHENDILGTGGGLYNVRDFFRGEENLVLVNGDSIYRFDIGEAVEEHEASSALATMIVKPFVENGPYRRVYADGDGRLKGIEDWKGDFDLSGNSFLFTGIHILNCAIFDMVGSARAFDINHGLYPSVLKAGGIIRVFEVNGDWFDVGNPGMFLRAALKRLESLGGVFIGEGARVEEGPTGHLYSIGEKAKVERRCALERCLVMEGASVGEGVRIVDSIVCPGTPVPPSSRVGEKVLWENEERPLEGIDV